MTWNSRQTTSARGYGYQWQRLRLEILDAAKHLCRCEECLRLKRIRVATEVNHIVPRAEALRRGWTEDEINAPSNLEAVSHACHVRITAEQLGHKPRPRPRIGLDGYPITDETPGGR